jgi:EAL domain-containing protein (putative c-di-GMP-specific phosphodiesterase class I)
VSIGLVGFGDEGLTLGELLKIADAACYIAKDQGRDRVHVYRTEDDAVGRRRREMSWVNRLQKAMRERRIVLYGQEIAPLAAPADRPHLEVLMRLVDEEGALVPPMAFIPAAERFHMMAELDRHVMKLAFSHWSRTHAADRAPPLYAINLSGASIGDGSFLPFVREQLARYGVPGRCVCFEITETSAIANLGNAVAFIGALKDLGCRFALDDFGSGMSSFGYLKQLAVDFLKIDGGFVRDVAEDPIDHAMVEAINRIGHVMGIRTIAESVENDAVIEKLRGIGVDYVQGYGIGRPQPLVPAQFPLEPVPEEEQIPGEADGKL